MACSLWLAGCASAPPSEPAVLSTVTPERAPNDWAKASSRDANPRAWQHYTLPGKVPTSFVYGRMDGREAMQATARASVSMLRKAVRIEPEDLARVRFSWKVPELIAEADMARRETDDSPVRVVLAFDGDRSRFSMKNAMLSELAQVLTGEPMPYATLMYVWCNHREPGSVILNPRTDRVRKLVVESGPRRLDRWLDYERDVRADYEKAFGEAPGALIGVAIMTDSDNTRTTTRAWYGSVRIETNLLSRK